jgi:hypothetical protein
MTDIIAQKRSELGLAPGEGVIDWEAIARRRYDNMMSEMQEVLEGMISPLNLQWQFGVSSMDLRHLPVTDTAPDETVQGLIWGAALLLIRAARRQATDEA